MQKALYGVDDKALYMTIISMIQPWGPGVHEFRVHDGSGDCQVSIRMIFFGMGNNTEVKEVSFAGHDVARGRVMMFRGGGI